MSLAATMLAILLTNAGYSQIPPANMAGQRPPKDADERLHNTRDFWLPVSMSPAALDKTKWLVLYVSTNQGKTWKVHKRIPADKGRTFRVKLECDGSFWFAVQTIGTDQTRDPAELSDLKPDLKLRVISTR